MTYEVVGFTIPQQTCGFGIPIFRVEQGLWMRLLNRILGRSTPLYTPVVHDDIIISMNLWDHEGDIHPLTADDGATANLHQHTLYVFCWQHEGKQKYALGTHNRLWSFFSKWLRTFAPLAADEELLQKIQALWPDLPASSQSAMTMWLSAYQRPTTPSGLWCDQPTPPLGVIEHRITLN